MSYCPHCGAAAANSEKTCRVCGAPLPAPPGTPAPKSDPVGRGLRAAISVVAVLCVVTGLLWALWPRLRGNRESVYVTPSVPMSGVVSSPAPAVPSPASAAPSPSPLAVQSLELYSHWKGTMRIENYQGDEPLNFDEITIWAYIGSEDGRCYFEIYDTESVEEDTLVILSMYADLYDDHLDPVIGEDDAWIFGKVLDETDAEVLTPYLNDGFLSFHYHYISDEEICDLIIRLSPD